MDLLGQLTGGGDDQGTGPVARAVQQSVQDGQHEGGRLAGAGLGGADQVLPGHRSRDGRFLDGRRFPVAQPVDSRLQARVKIELSESSQVFLLFRSQADVRGIERCSKSNSCEDH